MPRLPGGSFAYDRRFSYYMSEQECFFYPPGDAEALAAVLDEIAENPSLLEARRKRLSEVRERLSWQQEKAKYLSILNTLARRAVATPAPLG